MNFFKPEEIAAELYKAIESESRYRPGVDYFSAPPSCLAVVFNKLLERHFHEKMRDMMDPRAISSLMDLIFSKEAFVKEVEVTEQADGSRRAIFAFIDPARATRADIISLPGSGVASAIRDGFFNPSERTCDLRGWEIPEKTPEELVDEMMAGLLGDVK